MGVVTLSFPWMGGTRRDFVQSLPMRERQRCASCPSASNRVLPATRSLSTRCVSMFVMRIRCAMAARQEAQSERTRTREAGLARHKPTSCFGKLGPDTVEIIRTRRGQEAVTLRPLPFSMMRRTSLDMGRTQAESLMSSPDYFNRSTHPFDCQARLPEVMPP